MNKLLYLLDETIIIAKKELSERQNGIKGESRAEQLEKIIIPELEELKIKLINNDIPPKQDRYLNSFGYAFRVWGWNMQTPTNLYTKLSEIHREYKNM